MPDPIDKQTGEARPAIEFFGTEELLDELRSRSAALVIAMLPINAKDHDIKIRMNGRRLECVGLAAELGVVARLHSRNYWKTQPPKEDPNV